VIVVVFDSGDDVGGVAVGFVFFFLINSNGR